MSDTDKNLKKININDIKNKYILKALFNNIQKIKFLNIIRYNKNIQNKLDVDINTYKEVMKIKLTIEVCITKRSDNNDFYDLHGYDDVNILDRFDKEEEN